MDVTQIGLFLLVVFVSVTSTGLTLVGGGG